MTLQAAEFEKRMIDYIENEVALDEESVERDTDLLLSGLVDSLGVVLISGWIQDELQIEIDPVDIVLENFQTVSRITDYLNARGALASS